MVARLACVFALVLVLPLAASADVLVDTFDPGGTFPGTGGMSIGAFEFSGNIRTSRMGVRFQMGASDYRLNSITMPISESHNGVNGNYLRVRIAADSGNAPGTTLEVLSENQPVPTSTPPFTQTTTFNSVSHPLLTAGAIYWVVIELTSMPQIGVGQGIGYFWYYSANGPLSTIRLQIRDNALPVDPWTGSTQSGRPAFRVEGSHPCVADFDGNGVRVVSDIFFFIARWFAHDPATDIDGVPGFGVADIFRFLAIWFAGCP